MTKPVVNPMKKRGGANNPHGNPKVTPEIVQIIRSDPGTCRDVAVRFGLSFGQISRIRTGVCWSKDK